MIENTLFYSMIFSGATISIEVMDRIRVPVIETNEYVNHHTFFKMGNA